MGDMFNSRDITSNDWRAIQGIPKAPEQAILKLIAFNIIVREFKLEFVNSFIIPF